MVARAINQSKPKFRGARSFNLTTDLNGVAHVLEEAFRPDNNFLFSNTPWLRELGIALWTLNYAPGLDAPLRGFVWIEDGQIVGNLSLSANYKTNDSYYISNIAVKAAYRRQGIARALMQTTLEYVRQQGARVVFLNVRPNNADAIKLYQDLGFNALEMRGEWTLAALPAARAPTQVQGLRALQASDARALSDLMRAATPDKLQRYRPPRNVFEISWDDQLAETVGDFFTGQSTRRRVLERDGKLAAVLCVRGQRLFAQHRLALQTHPAFRGQVEDALVAAALAELARLPAREIRADAASTHPEFIAALERHGFGFLHGLTLMELNI